MESAWLWKVDSETRIGRWSSAESEWEGEREIPRQGDCAKHGESSCAGIVGVRFREGG